MANDDRYFPLLSLAAAWASDTGTPPEMVLRNLCDWVMRGAFPADALVTAAGDKIDPFDVFMSRKAAMAALGKGVYLDGLGTHSPHWGPSFLQSVLVSASGVRAFCQHTDTRLPSVLLKDSKKSRGTFRATHKVPPPCREADEYAARHQARVLATGTIDFLRETLAGLQGKPTRFGPRRTDDEAISLEYWEPRWRKDVDCALTSIDRCGDVHLQRQLNAIDAEWAALVSMETSRQPKSLSPPGDVELRPNPDRSAGRHSGGRLEEWYGSWVVSKVDQNVIPSRDDDWEAAKSALGDGVPRDKVRELRKKMAPPSWQKRGRRKSAGETGDKC